MLDLNVDSDSPLTGTIVKPYAEWPCLECGAVAEKWILEEKGPHLAANCPDCGGRLCSNSTWVSKPRVGLSERPLARPNDFSPSMKISIMERDGYKCFVCGRNPTEHGVLLHVDHVDPKGGPCMANGVTLCEEHNLGKSNRVLPNFIAEFRRRVLGKETIGTQE